MIAGTLAVLLSDVDEPLSNYHDSGFRALDVRTTQETLDGGTVQSGMVAGRVPDRERKPSLNGHRIDVETRQTSRKEATSWVADIDGAGWLCVESTYPTDDEFSPEWPLDDFERYTGSEIRRVEVDPGAFAAAQEDAGRDTAVEFVGRESSDGVSIEWGRGANNAPDADVGVALTTLWDGEFVRVIVYASGFIAVWEPKDWSEESFAQFVSEEVLPHTEIVLDDDEDDEQQTLDDVEDDDRQECDNCGHESDYIETEPETGLDLCGACRSYYDENGRLPDGNGSIDPAEVSA